MSHRDFIHCYRLTWILFFFLTIEVLEGGKHGSVIGTEYRIIKSI